MSGEADDDTDEMTDAEVGDLFDYMCVITDEADPADPFGDIEPVECLSTSANLPDDFWAERDVLRHIRQAAHARARSADAVLAVALARVAALVPPAVVLPGLVGERGSLNLAVGLVGGSGTGKTSAMGPAEGLVPFPALVAGTLPKTEVPEVAPLGSGEGLIERYFVTVPSGEKGKPATKEQGHDSIMFTLDEGQALAEMGGRSGATLLPTIRSAWSGSLVGQANADAARRRKLDAHAYRFTLVVGFQPEYAAGLIGDVAGGTPQRFLFASSTDPSIPMEAVEWPGSLGWSPPITEGVLDVAKVVRDEIRAHAVGASQGRIKIPELDSHRNLLRLKVAGLLALLESRTTITDDDWRLAGAVVQASCDVRQAVIDKAEASASAIENAGHARAARRESVVADAGTQRATERVAKGMARWVHRAPEEKRTIGYAWRDGTASRDRKLTTQDEALTYGIEHGWFTIDEAQPEALVPGISSPA